MVQWALVFLVVALMAGLLQLGGVSALSPEIAGSLLALSVVLLMLLVVRVIQARRSPPVV